MVVPGIISMIEWGLQNPGSALVRLVSTTVVGIAIGYAFDRYTSTADGSRLGGERPLPGAADQLHHFWRQRQRPRREVEEMPLENSAGVAA